MRTISPLRSLASNREREYKNKDRKGRKRIKNQKRVMNIGKRGSKLKEQNEEKIEKKECRKKYVSDRENRQEWKIYIVREVKD